MFKRAMALGAFALLALSFWAPAASAGGGCHGGQFKDERGVKVDLRDACFTPTVIRIQTGQSVTWTNQDEFAHTVTGAAQRWGTYDELGQGDTVTYRFQSSGVFPYFCAIHPAMVGAVVVGDGTSSETTAQTVFQVPVAPASVPPAAGTQTVPPQQAPVSDVSGGVSSLWRILAISAFGLFVVALAGLVAQRTLARRGAVRA